MTENRNSGGFLIVSRALLTDSYCCLFTSFTQRVMGLKGAEDICDFAAI